LESKEFIEGDFQDQERRVPVLKMSFRIVLIALLLSLLVVSSAFADPGPPVGGCPKGFVLHEIMDHEEHEHHHIGLAKDLNGDSMICVKHLSSGKHVHMDNVLPLP
jgi:hypothetical protein